MFVARWQIDARFGHKQTVIDLLQKWEREVGTKAGTDKMAFKILTGSIGAQSHRRGQSCGGERGSAGAVLHGDRPQ